MHCTHCIEINHFINAAKYARDQCFILQYGSIILPWLRASIGVTRSYSSRPSLVPLKWYYEIHYSYWQICNLTLTISKDPYFHKPKNSGLWHQTPSPCVSWMRSRHKTNLGRQRGGGVPNQKDTFRTRVLCFEPEVVCFSFCKCSKRLRQKLQKRPTVEK